MPQRTAWALLALAGCGSSPADLPPYGEILLEVDTNLPVPAALSRVRIDVFDEQRGWLYSSDFASTSPSDFPLSMSLYNESSRDTRSAWVRARGYVDGRLRDYLGERFSRRPKFVERRAATSLAQACDEATLLTPGQVEVARFRGQPFDEARLSCASSALGDEPKETRSGLAAFQIEIVEPGNYRIGIEEGEPGLAWAFVADPLLSLRTECEDSASQIACNDDEHPTFSPLSGLTQALEPGKYFALIGNVARGPMDIALFVGKAGSASGATPATPSPIPDEQGPRLVVNGKDITPLSEPEPGLAIDRLALVELAPNRRSTARLLLDGECLGTMADLAQGRSCVDREETLTELQAEPLFDGILHSSSTLVGSWPALEEVPCPPSRHETSPELFDERVCVFGGPFVLGDPTVIGQAADSGQPERMAIIPPLYLDRFEYSVGRYRAALQRGFEPPDGGPLNNFEGPVTLESVEPTRACSWNARLDGSALFEEQEVLPLSCVSWLTARALCQFDAGDLPSVAEREYAASAKGFGIETTYPWGEVAPACDEAVYGRVLEPKLGSSECSGMGTGPVAVDALPWASFDITPHGVVALGGNVAEWTRDSHRAYSDPCWQSQPLRSPVCWEDEAPLHTIAGGSWRSPAGGTRAAARMGGATAGIDPWIGFRCRYAVADE